MIARDWEATLRSWTKPSSDTEDAKCSNAERMIRDAIRESSTLSGRTIEVFAQGSYRNNTNVRLDSDVDICILCKDVIYPDFSMAPGISCDDVGLSDATYTFDQFKDEVEAALTAKFGKRGVTRGNKAFDVHENSYRVDADAVPCFEHRRYTHRRADGSYAYLSGTQFSADDGQVVINWPLQHIANGIEKNKATSHRFKYMVRALKRLRNEMDSAGITGAESIASFLIECLVWNVPNECFGHTTYKDEMQGILAHLFNNTISSDTCTEWGEVSELLYLFRTGKPWTLQQAHSFIDAAWDYIGFE